MGSYPSRLIQRAGDTWLRCRCDGAGMTRITCCFRRSCSFSSWPLTKPALAPLCITAAFWPAEAGPAAAWLLRGGLASGAPPAAGLLRGGVESSASCLPCMACTILTHLGTLYYCACVKLHCESPLSGRWCPACMCIIRKPCQLSVEEIKQDGGAQAAGWHLMETAGSGTAESRLAPLPYRDLRHSKEVDLCPRRRTCTGAVVPLPPWWRCIRAVVPLPSRW